LFLLKNETDTLLPAFIGGCPVRHPDGEHGVTLIDFNRLQPCWSPFGCFSKKGYAARGFYRLSLVMGFHRFASETWLWSCLWGLATSFGPPSPSRML
jgi:hypothetical protein